jgi:signal transduction histidine kinase
MVEARLEEGVVQIIIDDTGPGIPEESLSSAFEPFFRVDPARRQLIPGAGLGLAIAKEIIERQGGTLTISNRPPTGLRQIVTLKLPSKEAALELAVQPQSA